jgi:hypothetical protein
MEKMHRNVELEAELTGLRHRVDALERRISALEDELRRLTEETLQAVTGETAEP